MGYENALATKLLATHCACCARPLVDAKSVETGMGPTCRKKHGFDRPDLDVAIESLTFPIEAELRANTTREIANRIVYRVAIGVSHKDLHPIKLANYLSTLAAIGFVKLSNSLAKQSVKVTITEENNSFIVESDYNESFVAMSRRIAGRRWNAEKKVNVFPVSSKAEVFAALRSCYPGSIGNGPKGFFAI
jgi:hypothetical protein